MIVLSHRGYWKIEDEKNTEAAFRRSFSLGFGTETDVRDFSGNLVISHDPPMGGEMPFEHFLQIYGEYDQQLCLALNIKADGLQGKLKACLDRYNVINYYVFDMAVPDSLDYYKRKINAYTRQSEYERYPACYEQAQGIWLDEFYRHWITEDVIYQHSRNQKGICIVSPDLHGRNYIREWEDYRKIEKKTRTCELVSLYRLP